MSPANSAKKRRFFPPGSGTFVRGLPNDPAVKQDLSHRLLIAKGEADYHLLYAVNAAAVFCRSGGERWSCRCEPGCRRWLIRPSASYSSSGSVNNWGKAMLPEALGRASASWLPLARCAMAGGRSMAAMRPPRMPSWKQEASPVSFLRSPHPQAETPDLWRDVWERSLALLSWVLCLPTLGICRGMQLMNVALGGTIYQDLRDQWPRDRLQLLRDRARGRVSSSNWVTHPVQLTRSNSRLALAVKGRGEPGWRLLDAVLSMHHQAVETLAPGLVVAATAPDGVIEAFEDASPSRWWVATQFHPEWSTHLHWVMGLFTSFVDACRAYSAIARDEIEPLRAEIRDWLRTLDGGLPPRMGAPGAETEAVPALTQPLTRRTSTLRWLCESVVHICVVLVTLRN
jgi:gamma-glutamyl-gamma-aminobutyrate hydrolase PuuD